MKPKEGLTLRKIGSNYIIVMASAEVVNMTEVYSMNETAARMWQKMAIANCSSEVLADWLCETYEVDRKTALEDVVKQLEIWNEYGLLES